EPFNAGVLVFSTLSSRPLRTSWLIVGMGGLDLLPALGRALKSGAVLSCSVVPVLLGPPGPPARHRPVHAVGCVALPRDRPLSTDRTRSPLATRRRPPRPSPGGTPVPGRQDLRAPRRTANGSRPRAPWARLTTIPAAQWPVQTGSPCRSGHMSAPAEAAFHVVPTRDVREPFPGGRTASGPAPTVPPPLPPIGNPAARVGACRAPRYGRGGAAPTRAPTTDRSATCASASRPATAGASSRPPPRSATSRPPVSTSPSSRRSTPSTRSANSATWQR